ncbi:hypothetical protein GO986_17175 [Deinococcus sp. HMF7620]|uniref:Anaphase-promoting complex subunit 4 WD40 domain-containing protein n=1 Tax=Deinococcus arboris TaxID=2682977 RepID=A0A7C9LQE0_9DEIO|nr:hypothetical protein [Deinococcus arboris]MVN88476.1 hypothetical protein [Deinococcus arboris]
MLLKRLCTSELSRSQSFFRPFSIALPSPNTCHKSSNPIGYSAAYDLHAYGLSHAVQGTLMPTLSRWLLTAVLLTGPALATPAFLGPAQEVHRLKADYISDPLLSPDAHWMVMSYVSLTAQDKMKSYLTVLDLRTGQLRQLPLQAPGNYTFMPDSRTLVTAFGFRTGVNVVDVLTGKAREAHEPQALSEEYDAFIPFPDSAYVIATNYGRPATALRIKAKSPLALPAMTNVQYPLAFSPKGTVLVTESPTGLTVVNPKTWQSVREIRSTVASEAFETVFSPNGRFIALGKKQLQVIDVWSGKVKFTVPTAEEVSALAFSPDGKKIVVGFQRAGGKITDHSRGKVIQVFDAATGKVLQTMTRTETAVESLRFTPDGRALLAVLTDAYFDRHPSVYVASILKFTVNP